MGIEDGMPGIELTSAFSGLKVEKLGIVSPEFKVEKLGIVSPEFQVSKWRS